MRLLNSENSELAQFDNVYFQDTRDLVTFNDEMILNSQNMNEQWNPWIKEIFEVLRDNIPEARKYY